MLIFYKSTGFLTRNLILFLFFIDAIICKIDGRELYIGL
jgi:hypothetical protein